MFQKDSRKQGEAYFREMMNKDQKGYGRKWYGVEIL